MRTQHFENSLLVGKLWIGSITDARIILVVLVSYTFLQYYFIYYFSVDYYLANSLNWICIVLFLYSYLCGTFTEPGVVRRLQLNDEESVKTIQSNDNDNVRIFENKDYFQERFCSKCKVIRPPKTNHCDNCNNCVKLYDHHFTLMSNCIGQRNYKYFISWIYTLIIQFIIWYCTLFQHTFQMFKMSEALERLYQSQILQGAVLGLIISFYCSLNRKSIFQTIINWIIIICFCVCLYQVYNFEKNYYENYFCSLIFVIITFPGASVAFAVAILQSYHISIGVNLNEWSTLEKQINLINGFSHQTRTSEDKEQIIQDQKNQLVMESQDDIELRKQIIQEINDNIQLKGNLSKEKIEYIFQQRKEYRLNKKQSRNANLQVQFLKQKASLKNYFTNLIKLVSEKQFQSELY
ncbi:unnamed protein product [Paramecium sonneborni]|uniref:Palmitoyltransferase n=1 Tax=Paramecium sonneborni TaxID=65129 RepID=A0A8S1KC12_9CILI|nr:unnamed protein product [Paramecium sonneborni]